MKHTPIYLAAFAAIPLLFPGEALADRGQKDSFFYSVTSGGVKILVSSGNDRHTHNHHYKSRPKVVYQPVYWYGPHARYYSHPYRHGYHYHVKHDNKGHKHAHKYSKHDDHRGKHKKGKGHGHR